jgi:hypothetical protein
MGITLSSGLAASISARRAAATPLCSARTGARWGWSGFRRRILRFLERIAVPDSPDFSAAYTQLRGW